MAPELIARPEHNRRILIVHNPVGESMNSPGQVESIRQVRAKRFDTKRLRA